MTILLTVFATISVERRNILRFPGTGLTRE